MVSMTRHCVWIVLSVFAAGLVSGCQPPEVSQQEEACSYARQCVLKSLISPDSAKFTLQDWSATGPDYANVFICQGPVDAQNSFGASIRNDCAVAVQRIGDEWHCMHIFLFPRNGPPVEVEMVGE